MPRTGSQQEYNRKRRARWTSSSGKKTVRVWYHECGYADTMTMGEYKKYPNAFPNATVEHLTEDGWKEVAQECLL